MTSTEAADAIKQTCDEISKATLKLQPAIRALGNPAAQDELLKATYELTKQLEVVKKIVRKTQTGSATPLT
jgi:prefoldin subunit 5